MNTTNPNPPAPATPTEPAQPVNLSVVPAPKREVRVVEDESQASYLMDTARFEHCFRIAGAMARASLIPKHLKGENFEQTQANCFLVVNQAIRWGFDPFAVAPETYEVGGKLGFQGKLIAAVVNARGGLAEKLSFTFNDAKGDALEITVSGRLVGEEHPRTVTVTVGSVKTQNQMWTKDPQQKLVYTGAIRWARRHKPEVVLGVLTDDDLDAMREEARFQGAKRPLIEGPVDDGEGTDLAPMGEAAKKEHATSATKTAKVIEEAVEKPYEKLMEWINDPKNVGLNECKVVKYMQKPEVKLMEPGSVELIQATDANMRTLYANRKAVLKNILAIPG